MFTKNNMKFDSIAESVKKVMAKEAELDETGLRKAAYAAHSAGQKMFKFKGKTYPVKVQGENITYGECMEEAELDEATSEKVPTPTGMKVYGHRYGDSAKARKDQTKHEVDKIKPPKNIYAHGVLPVKEEGDCVTKPEAKDIAKKEVKGHEKKMHHKEDMEFANKLIETVKQKSPAKGTDVSDKSWLKDAGKKPTVKGDLKNLGRFLAGKKETNEEVDPDTRTKDMIRGRQPSKQKDDVGPGADSKSTKVKYHGGPMTQKEEVEELEEKNWIAGAIKKPGTETAAAKRAGMSVQAYAQKHQHDSGKAGKRARLAITLKKMHHEEVTEEELDEMLNEVLSKDATAGDWIHDFVHSDNPKFKGKSKAERKKMALGAYYAKQNEEAINEYSMDDVRKDAATMAKKQVDAVTKPKPHKSFLQRVGDKQIGMIKGAIKGLRGEEVELQEGQMKRLATDKAEDERLGVWKKETPWKLSKGTVIDKSGAKHTPMSRARDLARQALKKVQDKTKIKNEMLGKAGTTSESKKKW